MENAVPASAVTAVALVLIYSVLCLSASALLAVMLWRNGEKTSYIMILTLVVCLSTVCSIMQQFYYAFHWRETKITEWKLARRSPEEPYLAFTPLLAGFELAMYEIQYICYSINAMITFFWAIALAKGVFNYRSKMVAGWEEHLAIISKVISFTFPALFTGLSFLPGIRRSVVSFLAMNTTIILGSFGLGCVLMLAILVRYVHSRHRIASLQGSSSNANSNQLGGPRATKIRVDKVLLLRFSIAFFILAAFEVTVTSFAFYRKISTDVLAARDGPDFSIGSTINEILLFMPGVTASLLAFCLFGTTAQFRSKYVEILKSWKCAGKRRPSTSSSLREASHSRVWDRLDRGASPETYRCTVSRPDEVELELIGNKALQAYGLPPGYGGIQREMKFAQEETYIVEK